MDGPGSFQKKFKGQRKLGWWKVAVLSTATGNLKGGLHPALCTVLRVGRKHKRWSPCPGGLLFWCVLGGSLGPPHPMMIHTGEWSESSRDVNSHGIRVHHVSVPRQRLRKLSYDWWHFSKDTKKQEEKPHVPLRGKKFKKRKEQVQNSGAHSGRGGEVLGAEWSNMGAAAGGITQNLKDAKSAEGFWARECHAQRVMT